MKWKLLAITLCFVFAFGGLFDLSGLVARAAKSLPSTVIATPAVPVLVQSEFQWYQNIDGLDPTTPLASENATTTAQPVGTQIRVRMNVANDGGATFPAGNTFIFQYANATSGPWTDVNTSTPWAFFDNPSVADGQVIVNLLLGSSTVGESYGESNPSAAMPSDMLSGDSGEWDWSLVNLSATTTANWFFRMQSASGTVAESFARYPELSATTTVNSGGGGGGGGGMTVVTGGGGGPAINYLASSSNPNPGTSTTSSTASSTLPQTPPLLPPQFQVEDFNGDNRVDIVDFSIMLYYYGRSDQTALHYDLNHDGIVDLQDVSILMYYWTES